MIYGPGGVGKSALAVRVAHDVAAEFPDGQLYVDLCGSTPGMRPLAAVEVLGRFLRRLGVPPEQIPTDQAEAAALFRSATYDRRLLLVLDNASGIDQVVPLIPASPTCGVLATSRQPLASLDTDHRLRLGVLADADGLSLLTSLTSRLASEPEAAQSILSLSGGLPLAIRIAAGRLACRPDLSSTEYARRLADRSRRLDELQLEDLAVRASIRTSYDALLSGGDPAGLLAARAFRMLGLLHVPDVAPGVVAAMLAEPEVETARSALDRLVDAQLLEPFGDGRYRLHDLVRLVAAECANEEDTSEARDGAVSRVTAYYTGAVWQAFGRLQPARVGPFGDPTIDKDIRVPTFGGPGQANAWIDDEVQNLLAALEQATRVSGDTCQLAVWLGPALWNCLDARCEWQAAYQMSRRLVKTAEREKDERLLACGLLLHGRSEACLGRYAAATARLEQALAHMRNLGNPNGVTLTLNGLGIANSRQGDSTAALLWYLEALDVAERSRLSDLMAVVLGNMAVSYACLGKLSHALTSVERCVAMCAEIDAPETLGMAMNNMAAIHCLREDWDLALRCANRAHVLAHVLGAQIGHRSSEYEALVVRSEANRRRGHLNEAINDADRVLSLARAGGSRYMEAAALWQRTKILADMGSHIQAEEASQLARAAYAELVGVYRDPMTELVIAPDAAFLAPTAVEAVSP